jgi:hypothetical protein
MAEDRWRFGQVELCGRSKHSQAYRPDRITGMSTLGLVLLILIILLLLGAFPTRGYGFGYGSHSTLGVILIIIVVLLLMGRI